MFLTHGTILDSCRIKEKMQQRKKSHKLINVIYFLYIINLGKYEFNLGTINVQI